MPTPPGFVGRERRAGWSRGGSGAEYEQRKQHRGQAGSCRDLPKLQELRWWGLRSWGRREDSAWLGPPVSLEEWGQFGNCRLGLGFLVYCFSAASSASCRGSLGVRIRSPPQYEGKAVGKKEIPPFVTTGVVLREFMRSETSQSEKDKYVLYNLTYMWNLKSQGPLWRSGSKSDQYP